MRNRIKHVFFDLDHTLWDFDKNSDLAFIKIFKDLTIDIEISEFLKVYKPINTIYWNKYRNDEVSKSKLRYGRLKDTFDSLNYDITDLEINKISEVYIESLADHNYLLPNSKSILDYLFSKYKLHIITNGFEEVQLQKIVSSNIQSYFSKIITSESVGVKKPNPIIFNEALKRANALACESIMIGDNIEADINGALESGFSAILFNYHKINPPKEITTIDNLIELKVLL
ncbi:MAG: YjjG family noncanonical pyrimidine nucleotidase [Flavobacteriaceae bacterium]